MWKVWRCFSRRGRGAVTRARGRGAVTRARGRGAVPPVVVVAGFLAHVPSVGIFPLKGQAPAQEGEDGEPHDGDDYVLDVEGH